MKYLLIIIVFAPLLVLAENKVYYMIDKCYPKDSSRGGFQGRPEIHLDKVACSKNNKTLCVYSNVSCEVLSTTDLYKDGQPDFSDEIDRGDYIGIDGDAVCFAENQKCPHFEDCKNKEVTQKNLDIFKIKKADLFKTKYKNETGGKVN